jgi:hypothetical protein
VGAKRNGARRQRPSGVRGPSVSLIACARGVKFVARGKLVAGMIRPGRGALDEGGSGFSLEVGASNWTTGIAGGHDGDLFFRRRQRHGGPLVEDGNDDRDHGRHAGCSLRG